MKKTKITRNRLTLLGAAILCCLFAANADDGKLRIIVFGAHPDDCELKAGGQLAKRRTREVKAAAKILGIESHVMDNHDGELMPTLENRKAMTRLIREWKADVVMGHRPNDYHPDHRYTGVLMQDAAFMVTVSNFAPDTPQLNKNPVFLYLSDYFKKPNPFVPNLVVGIDNVAEQKAEALWTLESQIESFWSARNFETVTPCPPTPPSARPKNASSAKRSAAAPAPPPTASAKNSSSFTASKKAAASSTPKPSSSANTAANPAPPNSKNYSRSSGGIRQHSQA